MFLNENEALEHILSRCRKVEIYVIDSLYLLRNKKNGELVLYKGYKVIKKYNNYIFASIEIAKIIEEVEQKYEKKLILKKEHFSDLFMNSSYKEKFVNKFTYISYRPKDLNTAKGYINKKYFNNVYFGTNKYY